MVDKDELSGSSSEGEEEEEENDEDEENESDRNESRYEEISEDSDNNDEEQRIETPCKKRPRLDDSFEKAMEILDDEQDNSLDDKFEDYGSDNDMQLADSDESDVDTDDADEEMPEQETPVPNGEMKNEKRSAEDEQHQQEIQQLLEEPVDEQNDQRNQPPPNKIWKTVLDRLDNDHFSQLPDGWMRVTHHSGMPIYLHRKTRVITLSRPYFIGTTSVRNHPVPLSAVPCLHRKRLDDRIAALKEKAPENPEPEQKQEQAQENGETRKELENPQECPVKKSISKMLHAPAIQLEKQEDNILTPLQLRQYCEARFKFQQIPVTKYRSFRERIERRSQRRMEAVLKKAGVQQSVKEVMENKDMAIQGSSGMRLIKIPTMDGRFHKKNYVLNPVGKSPVNILNEYVQRAFSGRVTYEYEDARNVITPFRGIATLRIKKEVRLKMAESVKEKLALMMEKSAEAGIQTQEGENQLEDLIVIGRGLGVGKKKAKMMAAKDALATLIPNLKFDEKSDLVVSGENAGGKNTEDEKVLEVFDNLDIEDKRVVDYCAKANQAKPLALLKDAINRSIKWREVKLETRGEPVGNQKTKVTFILGDLRAEVIAVGAKKGKQMVAQSLLKQMHPDFKSYGSLLRRYANQTEKQNRRQAQRHHDEVVRLQNHGSQLQPNHAVISKLQEEMLKIEILSQQRPSFMNLPPNIPW
ncbi:hypothetical protein WR25_22310 isoform A [Diploscapter pachys]|uniref:DRBM domain-containing protein n=1 Tax=Diploscapter pachys TaxID=2018661 RepID=A0A2A2K4Y5_9BILA|nr:hypothetical protein WR25_22310 isoform A [Diploscapter pachys]